MQATLRLRDTPDHFLTLSHRLWSSLTDQSDPIPIAVALPDLHTPDPFTNDQKRKSAETLLPSLVAFARPIEITQEDNEDSNPLCYVPLHLARQAFGPSVDRLHLDNDSVDEENTQVNVQRINLVELDEMILGAGNAVSYELATKDPTALSALFSTPIPTILRHGFCYHLSSPDADQSFDFTVMMCNPVLQGVVSDRTSFIVTNFETPPPDNGFDSIHPPIESTDLEDDKDSDNFFPTSSDPDELGPTAFHFPLPQLSESDSDAETQPTGNDHARSRPAPRTIRPVEFEPRVMAAPMSEGRLSPRPAAEEDDQQRVFVGLEGLARCGVFSGDWVLVNGPDHRKSRLCKIYGLESLGISKSHAYLPPLLHFNLGFPLPPLPNNIPLTITRLSSADGAPLAPPPTDGAPLARAVTCARVASPVSVDKVMQPALLEALKRHFEGRNRVVAEGDLFAVAVDEDTARLRPQRTDSDVDVWEEISLPTAPTTPPSLVYFKITSVESDPASANGGAKNHPAYYGHGRRVDPLGTKMVQTGLEQSRVPPGRGVGTWVGGAAEFAPTPPPPSFTFTHTTTPPDTLYTLISSCLHPLSSTLSLSCTVLLHGPRGSGKRTSALWAAERCGVHVVETNCYDFAGETDAKTEASLRARFDRAAACAPCVFLIRNVDALARKAVVLETGQEPAIATVLRYLFADLLTSHRRTGYPTMVVATTGDIERLPTSVLGCFRHEVQVEAPAEPARLEILRNLTSGSPLAPDVSLRSLATQTAALVAKDLVDLVARAGLAALERVTDGRETTDVMDHDIASAGIALTAADFDTALGKARASYSDSIGAPKIPNVTWDDVGGLAGVKDDILDTIQLPLEHPELFASGMKKRSGILLYGPPGTGKTLLAKAIATSCSLNFFSVKGPELLNMYIGESEANVRRVFQRARDAKPCVIFFDELDSVAPKRGEKGDSGGVMDRIVSQLLAELDGMSEGKGGKDGEEGRKNGEEAGGAQVFVIGATNRPDLLDPALLRPGRFDKLLYLGVSQDHDAQLKIIQALTRKFRLHPDLDLRRVADKCPLNYTGADFYALCSDAMLKAMTRVADAVEAKVASLNATPLSPNAVPSYPLPLTSQYYLSHLATSEDVAVEVTEEDFDRARRELIPSVSESELGHYRKVRERFEGGMKEGKVDGKEEKEDDESAGGMKETKMEEEDDENTGRMKEARDDDDKEEEDESAGLMKEAKVDDDEEEEDESAGLMKEEKEDESVGGMNEEKEDESAGGMKAAKVDGEEEDENAGKEAKVDGKEEEGEDKSVGGMKEAKLDGEEEEAGDESAGGMKEAEDESAGGMKEAEDESAGGIKEAEDESAGGMKEAKDKSAGRMKVAEDESAGGMKEAEDESARGIIEAKMDGEEEEAEDKNAGGMKEGKVEEEGDESTGGKEKVDGEEEKEKDESAGGKGKVDGEEEEKENESADGKGKAEEEENGSASGKEVKEEQDGEREGEGEDVMG